jgi:hypothetical protein
MEPTDEMGVVIKSICGDLSFVVVLAVVTCGGLFLSPLPNDSELLVGMLNDLL